MMFEEMWDADDLVYTENRLRVHVLTLKKKGDTYQLMRLYGYLALLAGWRGDFQAAQDALNEQGFLLSDYGWRGTEREIWYLHDRAQVMKLFGREKWTRNNINKALKLVNEETDPVLRSQLEQLAAEVGLDITLTPVS